MTRLSDGARPWLGYTGNMVLLGIFVLFNAFENWIGSHNGVVIIVYALLLCHFMGLGLFSLNAITDQEVSRVAKQLIKLPVRPAKLPAGFQIGQYSLVSMAVIFSVLGAYLFYIVLLLKGILPNELLAHVASLSLLLSYLFARQIPLWRAA